MAGSRILSRLNGLRSVSRAPPGCISLGRRRTCSKPAPSPLAEAAETAPRPVLQPAGMEDVLPDAASSSNHHDLASFLQYAARTGLNPRSTVYVGTHYEYTVAASLARFGVAARRVGGASDRGIDLLGTWRLGGSSASSGGGGGGGGAGNANDGDGRRIKVLVQCKAGPIGPHTVRELEGAFAGAPPAWRGSGSSSSSGSGTSTGTVNDRIGDGLLGVLACRRSATRGVGEALGRSGWPMMFVCCDADGRISQVRWNQRAELEGLLGLGAVVRRSVAGDEAPEVVLSWKGELMESRSEDRAG